MSESDSFVTTETICRKGLSDEFPVSKRKQKHALWMSWDCQKHPVLTFKENLSSGWQQVCERIRILRKNGGKKIKHYPTPIQNLLQGSGWASNSRPEGLDLWVLKQSCWLWERTRCLVAQNTGKKIPVRLGHLWGWPLTLQRSRLMWEKSNNDIIYSLQPWWSVGACFILGKQWNIDFKGIGKSRFWGTEGGSVQAASLHGSLSGMLLPQGAFGSLGTCQNLPPTPNLGAPGSHSKPGCQGCDPEVFAAIPGFRAKTQEWKQQRGAKGSSGQVKAKGFCAKLFLFGWSKWFFWHSRGVFLGEE